MRWRSKASFNHHQLIFLLNKIYIVVYTNNRKGLPKECRFNTDEVAVNKIGEIVLLVPKSSKWNSFMQAIDMFSDDFMEDERDNDIKQERESL